MRDFADVGDEEIVSCGVEPTSQLAGYAKRMKVSSSFTVQYSIVWLRKWILEIFLSCFSIGTVLYVIF